MGCTSWIIRHKRIGTNGENNASIIERSIVWDHDSWDVGHYLTSLFNLPNGGYIYRDSDDLREIIQDAIVEKEWSEQDIRALEELSGLLTSIEVVDDLFVSVDY